MTDCRRDAGSRIFDAPQSQDLAAGRRYFYRCIRSLGPEASADAAAAAHRSPAPLTSRRHMTATGQISALETDHAAASSQPARVSVLTSSRPQHIAAEPFAHLVQRECLPIEQYRELAASFPSPEAILGSRQSRMVNAAARLPAFKVLDNPAITPAWRDFFAFHTSDGFWQEIVRVFGAAI